MSNVGFATLQIIPSARGFQAALSKQTAAPIASGGREGGKKFGGAMLAGFAPMAKLAGGAFAAVGVASVISDSVQLESTFSQTMSTMAAVADVPAAQIKQLSALALKMGADTSFSANEAADAMLELAKGGISAADIKAGALAGTLTLAAAGGTDLATAATIASNAMNTFDLKGRDMNAIAAALAGGANASSASVESLGEALGQVGPGAKLAGLSLQQTVGVLSAFDAAGIKGSDAGTSLKTMLSSLVPQSKQARDAMHDLGLKFTDAKGRFLPIAKVAEQLKTKLSGLSQAQRTTALNTIFGSDASRAAAVLMKLGANGVQKYTKATSDMGAAQRVAKARMSGTAGALEQMKGSLETAKLSLGRLIAPAVTAGAKALNVVFGKLATGISGLGPKLGQVKRWLQALGSSDSAGLAKALHLPPETTAAIFRLRDGLLRAGAAIRAQLMPVLSQVGAIFKTRVLPIVRELATFYFSRLVPAFLATATVVGQRLAPVFNALVSTLRTNVVPAVAAAWARFQTWLPTIEKVISVVVKMSGGVLKFAALILGKVLPPVIRFVGFLAGGTISAIINVIEVIARIIGAIIKFGVAVVGAVAKVAQFVAGLKTKFTEAENWVRGVPGRIASALGRLGSTLLSKGHELMTGLKNGVVSGFHAVSSWVSGIGGRIRGAISGAGSWLYSAGADVIAGFINGIRSMAGRITAAIRSTITDHLPGFVKDALGIHSPSRVFMELGAFTGQGFALGIESQAKAAQRAMSKVIAPPSAPEMRAAGGLVGAMTASRTPTPVTVPLYLDGRQVAEAVFDIGGQDYGPYGRKEF